jgi:hypothetical protein
LLWSAALVQASPQETKTKEKEKQVLTKQNKFYCNIKAVNPAERESHKQLTDKLISARKEIVETEKGYEFQYSPSNVSIAELADWVMAESKCCPFFDFHIGLEREGKLLCLRLTGEEGSNRSSGQSFRYCRNNCATHESSAPSAAFQTRVKFEWLVVSPMWIRPTAHSAWLLRLD